MTKTELRERLLDIIEASKDALKAYDHQCDGGTVMRGIRDHLFDLGSDIQYILGQLNKDEEGRLA